MNVSVQHLRKVYHDATRELVIIDNLSIEFPAGASIGVVGRSGIGKSTLLHLLGGLDRPTAGKVFYNQTDLYQLNDEELSSFRGAQIGFIFQFHHLLPEFSAEENVAMPLIVAGEARARARARELLDYVGLADRASHRPGQLSGGEQQRVAIARALISRPSVVLADEPTGNLDEDTGQKTQELLFSLTKETGATLLIVTHHMELAHSLDIILRMDTGGHLRVESAAVENAKCAKQEGRS